MFFVKQGTDWFLTNETFFDVRKKLEPRNYSLRFDNFRKQYFLVETNPFSIPEKVYGSLFKNTERFINTFKDREKSTGILLYGEKGSGKTLLSHYICAECNKIEMPTIIITEPFLTDSGNRIDYFTEFLQSIEQNCIFLFDEFEKVFDEEAQENILSFLGGINFTKSLFLFVANDKFRINQFMFNRPERIYYKMKFSGLEYDFIKEYCEEKLVDKTKLDSCIQIASTFYSLNFDMLKAIVEEVNRYNEFPNEALKLLNVELEDKDAQFDIFIVDKNGNEVKIETAYHSPLFERRYLDISTSKKEILVKGGISIENHIVIEPSDLKEVNSIAGVYVYNVNGLTVIARKSLPSQFNFDAI